MVKSKDTFTIYDMSDENGYGEMGADNVADFLKKMAGINIRHLYTVQVEDWENNAERKSAFIVCTTDKELTESDIKPRLKEMYNLNANFDIKGLFKAF